MEKRQRTNLFLNPDLWRRLRMRALEQGTSATKLLNALLGQYLQGDQTPKRTTTKRTRGKAS